MIRVAILDEVTPAAALWLKDLNPASGRALLHAAYLIRKTAVQNIQASFKRTGRNRTGGGQRGLKVRMDQQGGIRTVRIWHGSGILAAHELGSTVPARTFPPRRRLVLGKAGVGRIVERPGYTVRGFTLRRRATLEPAYQAQAEAVIRLLDDEYQKVFDTVPPALRTTIPPGA